MARVSAVNVILFVLSLVALASALVFFFASPGRSQEIAVFLETPVPGAGVTSTPFSMLEAPYPPPPLPTDTKVVTEVIALPTEAELQNTPPPPNSPTPVTHSVNYRIQQGDTLQAIASLHGLSPGTLQEVNGISDPRRLRVGQEIVIPLDVDSKAAITLLTPTHVVEEKQHPAPLALDPTLPPQVHIVPAQPSPGERYWRLVSVAWQSPKEAGGRHHIYIELLDENGQRITGEEVRVSWADGRTLIHTDGDKPEGEAVAFPQYGLLGSYSVDVPSLASDKISGLGLGTPVYPDKADHTCWYLIFQEVSYP
jgi:LysM repeat protein